MSDKKYITAAEAAEIGARAAIERIKEEMAKRERERRRERQELPERRQANVKLLLRNYRTLKAHAENAVYDAAECESPMEILEDMMQGRDYSVKVESIMRSAARTAVMVEHIDTMLELYRLLCLDKHSPEWERRWRVVDELYIKPDGMTVPEIAEEYGVVAQSIYNDIGIACERITALIFGVDGLALNAERKRRENKGD